MRKSRAAPSLASFFLNQRDMHGSKNPTTSLTEATTPRVLILNRRLLLGCSILPQTHPILQNVDIAKFTQRPLHILSMTKGIANPPYPPVVPRILSHVDKGCQAGSEQFQSRFERPGAPLGGVRHQDKDIRPSQVCSPVDHPLRSITRLSRIASPLPHVLWRLVEDSKTGARLPRHRVRHGRDSCP